jgi:hypothetical protein
MSQEQIGTNSNPLKKYYRQPKQFVRLPSGYKFYPEGSIQVPESGDVAVYPMTAKDEMLLKTPDALLNGEATVTVIQSCIPSIKNAWAMPSIDCDAALMTIRMATYGTSMTMPIKVPGTSIEKELVLDLQESLNSILSAQYNDTFFYQNMEVKTKPLTYKEFTESAIQTFEQQRIQKIVDDTKMNDEEKVKAFQATFKKLTELSVGMVANTIASITVDGETVTDIKQITEFLDNTDKQFFSSIMEHLEKNREAFQLKPQKITSTEEEVKNGAPAEYTIPVAFDSANFFV